MIGNPQIEFKTIDAHTIEVQTKEITDEHIWKLESIKKRLDTYNINKMSWFEYDYEPYNSWGERPTITPSKRKYENYTELLDNLIERSQDDRRRGWSNRINFLNITLKLEGEKSETKSNEIKQLIFDFLEENPKGIVHLVYPPQLENTGGIEIGKETIKNPNKIRFMETGIFIRETLGYSLITGKHLFIPYENCLLVFIENED